MWQTTRQGNELVSLGDGGTELGACATVRVRVKGKEKMMARVKVRVGSSRAGHGYLDGWSMPTSAAMDATAGSSRSKTRSRSRLKSKSKSDVNGDLGRGSRYWCLVFGHPASE